MGRNVIAAEHQSHRNHAVAAMNRGHSAMGNDDSALLEIALAEYQLAIDELRNLPLADHPDWANSLGAALMNRGSLLHRTHGVERADDALEAFREAIAVLSVIPVGKQPWASRNLAGTRLNRANLLIDLRRHEEAREDAEAALQLVNEGAGENIVDAELALKARRALCDALGQLVVSPETDQDSIADQAGDVVDDALTLVRHWESRGVDRFRSIGIRLFIFGAELYRRHQPHFLAEFVFECVNPQSSVRSGFGRELIAIAREKLTLALRDHDAPGLHIAGDPATERRLQTRAEIALALERFSPAVSAP